MKAFVIERHIKPHELPATLRDDVPPPKVGKDQVLVEVYSAALNFFDILQIQGKYQNQPPHPYVPGAEFAGVISSRSPIPEGCPYAPGTRVFGATQGAYGELAAADWQKLVPVPEGMSFEEASGLFVTYPTSYAALVIRAKVQKGETVLVHAGAGGVGLCAIQIAKALGATVIATAGSEDKLEVCKRFGGADFVINYRDTKKWQEEVKRITKGKGADVVYDPVGMVQSSLKIIAWNGRILVVGFAAGSIEKIPMNLVLLKNISLVGVHWGAYSKNEVPTTFAVWQALLEMFAKGEIKPVIYERVFAGLEEVPKGLAALANRETWGKAVVRIKPDPQHPPNASRPKL